MLTSIYFCQTPLQKKNLRNNFVIYYVYIEGLRCVEVPINFKQRFKGDSKIPRLQAFYSALKLIELFFTKKK